MKRLQDLQAQLTQKQKSSTNPFTKIALYYKGSVGYISMRNHKNYNIIDQQMSKQLSQAVLKMHYNPNVNVIVIISQIPNIFCVGIDVKFLANPNHNYQYLLRHENFSDLPQAFQKNRKPTIAAINGKAKGGGFELALFCDIIVASEKAQFQLPQINNGLVTGHGGINRFAKIVGQKKAMKMILAAETFSAKQAWKWNIAEKVSASNFNEQVDKLSAKISSKPLSSLIIAKKSQKQAINMTQNQGLEYQKDIVYSLLNTKETKEAISAFINRNKT